LCIEDTFMYYSRIEKDEPNPLEKRLLDSSHGSTDSVAGMSKEEIKAVGEMTSPVEAKSQQSKYNQYLAGRIYASNAPKIFLETISARTAALIIALTYIFFILGFCVDFYTTYQSFHSTNFQLPALACTSAPTVSQNEANYYSCADGKNWNGTITDLSNVISVKLNVFQSNITSILSNATSEFDVTYNIKLWACYNEGGCGDQFAPDTYYTNDFSVWQHVYTEFSRTLHVDVSADTKKDGAVTNIEVSLIPSLFQNQESIPTNGLVKSYFINMEYINDPYDIFVNPSDPYHLVYYNFDVVERPRQLGVNAVTIILLMVTLVVLVSYVVMLSRQKKVLSEQKWVVAYFVLLVMFQNPVYCVIVFYKEAPHANTAYASYVIGYIAQAGLFILWLLFADSVHRKTSSKLYFYLPKVLIGLTIFTFSILILTFQFPGLSAQAQANEHARSAVEAVANWSPGLKNKFISFTIIYLILIWLW